MQSEGQPEEHLQSLMELIGNLCKTAAEMKESSRQLRNQYKRHLDRLEAAGLFNWEDNNDDSILEF